MTTKILRGVVHGNVVELEGDAGLHDGEQVEVVLRRLRPRDRQPGEGFRRTEGALADDEQWDAILQEVQAARG